MGLQAFRIFLLNSVTPVTPCRKGPGLASPPPRNGPPAARAIARLPAPVRRAGRNAGARLPFSRVRPASKPLPRQNPVRRRPIRHSSRAAWVYRPTFPRRGATRRMVRASRAGACEGMARAGCNTPFARGHAGMNHKSPPFAYACRTGPDAAFQVLCQSPMPKSYGGGRINLLRCFSKTNRGD